MSWLCALRSPLRDEVHLDVRDVRAAAQEVVAHEAVEIERRGDAGVDLVIGDLRFRADGGGDLARGLRGAFERAALGHVQDDLELALVVEGQHFHLHPAERDGRHREQQQRGDRAEKKPAPARLREQRSHHAAIEPGEEILRVREVAVRAGGRGAFGQSANISCPSAGCGSTPTA